MMQSVDAVMLSGDLSCAAVVVCLLTDCKAIYASDCKMFSNARGNQ